MSLACSSPFDIADLSRTSLSPPKAWRIAIPTQHGELAEYFVSARRFSLYVASPLSGKVSPEEEIRAPENRLDLWPLWLADNLVNAVIVQEIPPRLRSALQELEIFVYSWKEQQPVDLDEMALTCYHQSLEKCYNRPLLTASSTLENPG